MTEDEIIGEYLKEWLRELRLERFLLGVNE